MSLLALGVSHRTAPVPMLERLALAADAQTKLLHELTENASIDEAMVVATCNRVEVYVEADKFHPAVDAATEGSRPSHRRLARRARPAPLRALRGPRRPAPVRRWPAASTPWWSVSRRSSARCVSHCGPRRTKAALGRELNDLVQTALRVGKRAHSETGIDQAGASLVSVGLDLAARSLEGLDGADRLHRRGRLDGFVGGHHRRTPGHERHRRQPHPGTR